MIQALWFVPRFALLIHYNLQISLCHLFQGTRNALGIKISGLSISPTNRRLKKNRKREFSQVDTVAVDSRGTLSPLFKASQSISLRILKRSSMDTKPAWGTTIPGLPALWIRTILVAISGPWSFPVNNTRSGMKSDLPCNQHQRISCKVCSFKLSRFCFSINSITEMTNFAFQWFAKGFHPFLPSTLSFC